MTVPADPFRFVLGDEACPGVPPGAEHTASAIGGPRGDAEPHSVHFIDLIAGGSTHVLRHERATMYYVRDGAGSFAVPETGTMDALIQGSMIFIDAGTAYQFIASVNGMVLLGGPRAAEPCLGGLD